MKFFCSIIKTKAKGCILWPTKVQRQEMKDLDPAVQVEGELDKFLDWNIETSKEIVYPGEPVLLKLKIKNNGDEEVKINFGSDGIKAFSIEIRNSANEVVAQ